MEINTYLDHLANGILSNLAMCEEGKVNPTAIKRVIGVVEEGLLDLYSRFILKEDVLYLVPIESMSIYTLGVEKTFSQKGFGCNYIPPAEEIPPDEEFDPATLNPVRFKEFALMTGRYIMDSDRKPYTGDYLKPLSIYDSLQNPIPLNDLHLDQSFHTPSPNTIQIPFPELYDVVSIEYQAKHPKLCVITPEVVEDAPPEPVRVEGILELPNALLEQLTLFVGSKIHSYMNTQESVLRGREYMSEYERKCAAVLAYDTVNSSRSFTNSQFEQRGWV